MTEDESLRRAIDEEVALVAFDPSWARMYELERERLMALFPGQWLDVQHIGSTAVTGMPAKPVLDLMAGVESMAVADAMIRPLEHAGYATSAEFNATLSDRRWFMRWLDGRRTHHLHVVVLGGQEWRRRLRFRDALRADAQLADRYAALKLECARRFGKDREAYTHAKSHFVLSVCGEA